MASVCLACDLASGARDLPGGRIHATPNWIVEHCVGPLGVGTLLVKPLRHCLHVGDLTLDEANELGPLLRLVAGCVRELAAADQVYVCLWSHMNWEPGHIHFVIQPSWARLKAAYGEPGPAVQLAMFRKGEVPPGPEVEAFCERARAWFETAA